MLINKSLVKDPAFDIELSVSYWERVFAYLGKGFIFWGQIFTSEANRVPIPRKSPSPSPKFGDRVGTGKVFLESWGKIQGLGELNSWGFLGTNSPKIPKV